MKIYKITEANEYLGMTINTLKMLANNGKVRQVDDYKKAQELLKISLDNIHDAKEFLRGDNIKYGQLLLIEQNLKNLVLFFFE